VRRALDAIATGAFNSAEPALFRPIVDSLTRDGDCYMLLADIESYAKAQSAVETLWKDERAWTRAAILNVARMAYFSSDRAIHEYAKKIWNVSPVPVRESK
jgi:starch phosphorylase